MIAIGLTALALAAAPHVVVVKRSEYGGASAQKVIAEVSAKLNATIAEPCARGVDCVPTLAIQSGIDVVVGVSVAAGARGSTSVDLEAIDHYGRTVATWTGKLPLDAPGFFTAVLQVEPFPIIPSEPPPSTVSIKPSTVLFVSAALLAAGALGTGVAGAVIDGPLHAKLQMTPYIPGLTRDAATQQVNQVNGLVTACLTLALTAAGVALAGVIALLF
jgi:hypothetical protein